MSLPPGTRIGPYEILAPLGAGGMGEVYRARDARLGRDVAVKVLPANVADDPDRRARFEREARAVAALSHPNILAIFDVGLADGTAYAATELLEGETLRASLGVPFPLRKAIDIAGQIARGLSSAHDKGIVHRDLKPENVFLTSDGQVKILDFGLAKAMREGNAAETAMATNPGTVLGTVGYMAPEQIRGQAVDGRADLFALGVVFYEMLAGRRAFERETAAETMTAILKEDPTDLATRRADLPASLENIVRHCLERNPAERFQSARDLVFSLQALSSATGSGAVAAAALTGRSRTRLRSREGAAWAIVAAMAVALGAGCVIWRRGQSSGAPPTIARFQVNPPDKSAWGAPLGAPAGSNSGTISPDGRTLAFVATDTRGKPVLWVRPIDSFSARPLEGTDGAAFPFWSPDSRFLGFFTQTRLKRIAADGGPIQTITELNSTPRGGTWGADGVILLATSGSPVWRVSADGGSLTAVSKPDAKNPGHQWPAFLPDGRHFLYYGSGTRRVFLGSLDAGAGKELFSSDSNAIFAPPGHILFIREGALFAQPFDAQRLELAGEAAAVVTQVSWTISPWNLGAFSVSTNATLTYRLGGGNSTQFAWYDRSGHQLQLVGPPGDYGAPSLSPDETKVAFTRRDDQAAGDIWTMDLARQTLSRFTFDAGSDIYPVWSSDGRTIVYESTRDGVFARNADGAGTPALLYATPSSLIPVQVMSDRKLLLFFADFGGSTGFDIFTLPLEGDKPKPAPAVRNPVTDSEPMLSPDGRWLAYSSVENAEYDVFVQPFPATGAKWQISTGGGRQPAWRRDGRELYFVTNDGRFFVVDVHPGATFDFSAPRLLFKMPANTISVRNSYVPGRDGRRFFVNMSLDTAVPAINVDLDWAATRTRGAEPR